MADVQTIAGVSRANCRKLKNMRPQELYNMPLGVIMRVCMVLRVSPTALIPALGRVPHNALKGQTKYRRSIPKTERELDLDECAPNMTGEITPLSTEQDLRPG